MITGMVRYDQIDPKAALASAFESVGRGGFAALIAGGAVAGLTTVGIGTLVALIASLTPIGKLEEMVNIGTLAAFTLVSIAVPILRRTRPDLRRPFRVPFSPVVPIVAAVICFYLMLNLGVETWLRFAVWMALGS